MFDPDYLIKREQQELEAARRASDVRVRRLHLEMADAYTLRISELKRQERLSTMASVNDRAAHVQALNAGQVEESLIGC